MIITTYIVKESIITIFSIRNNEKKYTLCKYILLFLILSQSKPYKFINGKYFRHQISN